MYAPAACVPVMLLMVIATPMVFSMRIPYASTATRIPAVVPENSSLDTESVGVDRVPAAVLVNAADADESRPVRPTIKRASQSSKSGKFPPARSGRQQYRRAQSLMSTDDDSAALKLLEFEENWVAVADARVDELQQEAKMVHEAYLKCQDEEIFKELAERFEKLYEQLDGLDAAVSSDCAISKATISDNEEAYELLKLKLGNARVALIPWYETLVFTPFNGRAIDDGEEAYTDPNDDAYSDEVGSAGSANSDDNDNDFATKAPMSKLFELCPIYDRDSDPRKPWPRLLSFDGEFKCDRFA